MFCVPFFTDCGVELLAGPAGAGVDLIRQAVFWTPSAQDVNASRQFVLATVPDSCGERATQSWSVAVVPAPAIESFSADRTIVAPGETVTLTALFQGTGSIDGVGAVSSAVPVATAALSADTSFVLRVTNVAGAQLSQHLGIQVLSPPAIGSFTATPSTIGAGGSTTLRWTISGDLGNAQLTPPGVSVGRDSSLVVSPGGSATYALTASNAFTSVSATVDVTVVPSASIRSFSATPASTSLLGAVSLSADFDGVNGRIERELNGFYTLLANVASGAAVDAGPLYRSSRFRLTVENALGAAVTRDLLVPLVGPGTFQPTSGQPLAPNRSSHTATRLADGRVFIAGGNNNANAQTEIFDPSNDSFTAGPSFLAYRRGHQAVLLADGRVFITGGCAFFPTPCRTTELFDITAGTVSPGPVIANGPADMVALADGRVLILTDGPGTPPTRGAVLFDPASGTLSSFISFANPFFSAQAAPARLLDGRVLLVNSALVELFTPAADSFSPSAASPPAGRSGAATSTLLDGRVLFTGGLTLPGTAAEAYEPQNDAFVALGTQQIADGFGAFRGQSSTRLQNGAVLLAGGDGSPLAQRFDPASGLFSVTGGLRTGRSFNTSLVTTHTATLLDDGRVLVVGGCAGLPCESEVYTP